MIATLHDSVLIVIENEAGYPCSTIPRQETPANYRIDLISPETRAPGLHCYCRQYGSIFIQFLLGSEILVYNVQSGPKK